MTGKKWNLAVVQKTTNALEIFTSNNVENLVRELEGEVRSIVCDVTTPKGRKEIASLAHKVSRSKTALDSLGKDLVSEWKAKSKAVDSERKQIRDRLDALRDEVRNPLTEWEETEKIRLEKEKLDKEIAEAYEQALVEDDLFNRKKEIERKEEEQRLADQKRIEDEAIIERERIAKQEAEEAERTRIERDERLQREAAETAKREAEQLAAEEKLEAEQKVIDAQVAEENAKRELQEAESRRLHELKDQEERLKLEHAEKEEAKLIKEAADKEKAEQKAANKRHQKLVNNKLLKAICDIGISEEHAKTLITKTAKNEVQNLKITY